MNEWISKTKQSAIVFNTPAFWSCHGWKLGEYLAMGKCIISVRYPEIERFADYVYMYSDSAEFLRILQELKQKECYN